MYKDKEKQKVAAKAAKQRWKTKQGIPDAGIPQGIPDVTGNVHQIDYEGRRRDFELLKGWHDDKGTEYQQALGELARKYSVINGYLQPKTYKLTPQGKRYLGYA